MRAVYSMTGFGQAAVTVDLPATDSPIEPAGQQLKVSVELRSVNSRFLDLSFKLPDELRHAEPALRELIAARVKRGKLEVRASYESARAAAPSLDTELLVQLQGLERELRTRVADIRPLGAADWLRFPGVVKNQSQSVSAEAFLDAGRQAAALALDEFLASRAREGSRLADFMGTRCDELQVLCQQAEQLMPAALRRQQEKFTQRWQEALASLGARLDQQALDERALNEAAGYAIRVDIAEELGRLRSHVEELKGLIRSGGELGKRLDFLVQEMNREANTLGSKSASLELTRVGVEMKVQIEQVREQVQNLE